VDRTSNVNPYEHSVNGVNWCQAGVTLSRTWRCWVSDAIAATIGEMCTTTYQRALYG